MEIINNLYRVEKQKLGSGSFSVVYMGTDLQLNRTVAIKKIPLTGESNILSKITPEVEIMKKLYHVNIVAYYDVCKLPNYLYIIMEHCNAGSLQNVILFNKQAETNKDFNREANTYYFMSQLKDALDYIRSEGYIHRDIKPMNVLLTKEPNLTNSIDTDCGDFNILFENKQNIGSFVNSDLDCTKPNINYKLVVKLADFGLARQYIDDDDSLLKTYCGSPRYMGPELLLDMKYNSKTDLWSYGVIMYEMLFGVGPIEARTVDDLKKQLRKKDIDFHLNKKYTANCFDLLRKLLVKDYESRIEWSNFFSHPWFTWWEKQLSLSSSIDSDFVNNSTPYGTTPELHKDPRKTRTPLNTPSTTPTMPINTPTASLNTPTAPLNTQQSKTNSLPLQTFKSNNLTKMEVTDYNKISTHPKSYAEYHSLLKYSTTTPITIPMSIPSKTQKSTRIIPNTAPAKISSQSPSPHTPSPHTPSPHTPSHLILSNNSLSPNSPLVGNKFINQRALQKSLSTFSTFSV